MDNEPLVTFVELRELEHCANGIKSFCDTYGIPLKQFRTGVPVSVMRATGFYFAIQAAEYTERKYGKG